MTIGVSVLMVTHDHAHYIEESVASALAQGPAVREVVLVDDGSRDATVEKAAAIGDPRVRIIRPAPRGIDRLAETYNEGLMACRADVVALLEGDDRWPLGKIARQLSAFDDPEVVLSHGLYAVIGARGRQLHTGVGPSLVIPRGVHDPRPYLLRASYIMAVTVAMRRSTLERAGGFRQLAGTHHWDYPTFLRLAEEGPFHFTPEVLGEWRRHERSATYRLARDGRAGIDNAVTRSTALALAARSNWSGPGLPSAREIQAAWREAEAHGVWQSARILLLESRFSEARELIRKYLSRPYPMRMRLRLIAALVAALLHVDLERVMRLVRGRTALEQLE